MSQLRALATQIDEGVSESVGYSQYGAFIELLVTLLPMFLQLFSMCPKKPAPPAPVDPTPDPTPEQSKAWTDAWDLKQKALSSYSERHADYDRRTLNAMARQVQRKRGQDGEKIKRPQALEIARETLDAARNESMPALSAAVLEASVVAAEMSAAGIVPILGDDD